MSNVVVRTIPLVGAISLAGCVPIRGGNGGGGNNGDDDDSVDPIVGSWELRSFSYDGESSSYPYSYTEDGCTSTASYLLDVLESGGALFTYRTEYTGSCEYSTPYVSTYDGTWTQLSSALYRIVRGDEEVFSCGLDLPELACTYDDALYTFRRD